MSQLWKRSGGRGEGAAPVADVSTPEEGPGPRIALAPTPNDALAEAVRSGGGRIVSDPGAADAVVWTDPRQPEALRELLLTAQPRWVQLPFAGIEQFFAAGAIDDKRLWTCAKGIYGPATAEHALALVLAVSRRIHEHARASSWRETTFGAPERRLAGRTILIVGTGGIGRALVPMLKPLGPKIVAVNRSGTALQGAVVTEPIAALPHLLGDADVVVVAAAATKDTYRLFDRGMLEYMRRDAWLINVARGSLVDTEALVEALEVRSIGGAALDVTDPEPLPSRHPLWDLPNALITPHVANTWDMALPELAALTTRNVRRFALGKDLEGIVDVDAGY